MSFVAKLKQLEKCRFARVLSAVNLSEECEKCYSFNPTIKDRGQAYRCFCLESCPGAALSLALKSYIWWKLDWITEEEHLNNVRHSDLHGVRPVSDRTVEEGVGPE